MLGYTNNHKAAEHKTQPLSWFINNWKPGDNIEVDLNRLKELLAQISLRYQLWQKNADRQPAKYGIGWDAKGQCPLQLVTDSFILELYHPAPDTFDLHVLEPKSFRNIYHYQLKPGKIRDVRNNLIANITSYANVSDLWHDRMPGIPYDPFEL
jgi:hypothetical protein